MTCFQGVTVSWEDVHGIDNGPKVRSYIGSLVLGAGSWVLVKKHS